ncbi:hypothetical protein LINPERPRIM_LOCUS31608 [Linum perenne]
MMVFLALLSSFTIQLPSVFNKDLFFILASPRFVFVVGNMIVLLLFVNSGMLSGIQDEGKGISTRSDIYEEFVEMSGKGQAFSYVEEEENYRGKQSDESLVVKEELHVSSVMMKTYERSKSEKLVTKSSIKKPEKELRRSVTEKLSKKKKGLFPEDDMSNEEFKSAVDAFIERQKRSLYNSK